MKEEVIKPTSMEGQCFRNGAILLLWGYIVLFVLIVDIILMSIYHDNVVTWVFVAIPVIGGIATPLMVYRQKRRHGKMSYADKIIANLWIIFAAAEIIMTLVCLSFAYIYRENVWVSMFMFSCVLFPIVEIFQGYLEGEKILTACGILGLLMGYAAVVTIVSYFFPDIRDSFIIIYMLNMIIPGHILNYKAKRRSKV